MKRTLVDAYGWAMPVERFGGGRPPLSTAVLSVLKSAMNCPPGAVFVRCDLPVLLHVAMNVVFRAVSFRRIMLAVHSPLSIFGVQPQRCVCALPHQKSSPMVSRPIQYFLSPTFSLQPKHLLVPKTRSILFLLGKSHTWRVLIRRGRFLVRQTVIGFLIGMSPTTLTLRRVQ